MCGGLDGLYPDGVEELIGFGPIMTHVAKLMPIVLCVVEEVSDDCRGVVGIRGEVLYMPREVCGEDVVELWCEIPIGVVLRIIHLFLADF